MTRRKTEGDKRSRGLDIESLKDMLTRMAIVEILMNTSPGLHGRCPLEVDLCEVAQSPSPQHSQPGFDDPMPTASLRCAR